MKDMRSVPDSIALIAGQKRNMVDTRSIIAPHKFESFHRETFVNQ